MHGPSVSRGLIKNRAVWATLVLFLTSTKHRLVDR